MNIEGQFLLFIGLVLFIAWGIWRILIHLKEKEEEARKVEEENKKRTRQKERIFTLST